MSEPIDPSPEEVRDTFNYDPLTGIITRRHPAPGRKRSGGIKVDGYNRHKLNGRSLKAGRLAYLWMVGVIPEGCVIDHFNWDRGDDRWCNLRAIPNLDNLAAPRPDTARLPYDVIVDWNKV